MIALLSGARRNVGDHLITERARALLEALRPEPLQWFPNWEPLDDRVEELRDATALVIAGGPGLRPKMYGGVYPLFSDPEVLLDLKARLVFLGSGWKALIGDSWDFRHEVFDSRTRGLLDRLGDRAVFSVRDNLSREMLRRNGIDAEMTGCPVWYDLNRMGTDPQTPKAIARIVFTEPRNPAIRPQSLGLLSALQVTYPGAQIVCSCHHGFDGIEEYVADVERMGIEVRDTAADTARIAFYDDFDVHVGYRVHAGLYFLSHRKPSVIVCEDARGRGAAEALGVPWIPAWAYTAAGAVTRRIAPYGRVAAVSKRLGPLVVPRRDVPRTAIDVLSAQQTNGWRAFRGVGTRIDSHYHVMKRYIESF